MTKYYSNKPDFPGDPISPLVSSSSYFKSMSDIMDDIEGYYGPEDPRNEYARILSPVENLETGDIEESYVYHYVPDDLGTPENPVVALAHGSWRTFMEKNNEPSNH